MTAITGSVPPSPRGKALVREENLQTKIIRLGFDSPSRLFFYYIVFRILHVLTRVCVYPHAQTSAARTAHRGSGRGLGQASRLRIGSSVTLADCPPRQRSQKRISERKPSPEGKVARHLSSIVICMVTFCNRSSVKSTESFAVP